MKLSEQLQQDHACGDFGLALTGYPERAKVLEDAADDMKWISVEDRLPEDGGFMVGTVVGPYGWGGEVWAEFWDESEPLGSMTHWMPLPDVPTPQ